MIVNIGLKKQKPFPCFSFTHGTKQGFNRGLFGKHISLKTGKLCPGMSKSGHLPSSFLDENTTCTFQVPLLKSSETLREYF